MTTPIRERHTIDTITNAHTAYSWAVRGEIERVMATVDAMTPEGRACPIDRHHPFWTRDGAR